MTFRNLEVYALGRKDLMATKFYAGSARDREYIQAMKPTDDELEFVKYYLSILKVPSREANLDQIDRAFFYLTTFGS